LLGLEIVMDPRTSDTRTGRRRRAPRIFVIDDEPCVLNDICLVLSNEFDVSGTTDPVEALDRLRTGASYAVILCDVAMPALDGITLRNRVHAADPDLATRIVLMTSGSLEEYAHIGPARLPNECLRKPLDLAALRGFLRERVLRLEASSDIFVRP
jgi:two-component system response regulator MprA